MPSILIDFHHPGLWKSLNLTLHDRLGYTILRPVGMEWYDEGYWQHEHFWAQDKFAKMFLTDRLDLTPKEGQVTLEEARAIRPDVIISTVPGNCLGFAAFAREVGARVGQQVGNNEHFVLWDDMDFILDSTSTHNPPEGYDKHLLYDQEIDPRYFEPVVYPGDGTVSSFLSVWHRDEEGLGYFDRVAGKFPERFNLYGEHGTSLGGDDEVIPAMQRTSVVWNAKKIGDGWGHVIHSAIAMGKPVISNNNFYKGMRAERMLKDNPGVINIAGMGIDDVEGNIKTILSYPELQERMGTFNKQRFAKFIDYDEQAKKIGELLDG